MSEPAIEALITRAEALHEVQRFEEARPLLLRALAADPRHARAACLLSLGFLQQDRPAECLREAERAIAIAPEREWGHRLRSAALLKLGRRKEGQRSAEEAVRLAPHEPLTHAQLAKVLLAGRKAKAAEDAARAALRLAPAQTTALLTLGLAQLQRWRARDAERTFRQLIAIDPTNAAAHNNLGLVLLRRFQFRAASQCFAEALRLSPTLEVAPKNLNVVYARYALAVRLLLVLTIGLAIVSAGVRHDLWLALPGVLAIGLVLASGIRMSRQLPKGLRRELFRQRWRRPFTFARVAIVIWFGLMAVAAISGKSQTKPEAPRAPLMIVHPAQAQLDALNGCWPKTPVPHPFERRAAWSR